MSINSKKHFLFIFLLLTSYVFSQNDAFTNEVEHKDGKVYFNNRLFSGTLYSEEDGINNDCDCTLKAHYKKGLLHGTKKTWYHSGKLKEILKYNNGILLQKKLYYSNGKPKKKEEYEKGQLVSSVLYNKDGTLKSTGISSTTPLPNNNNQTYSQNQTISNPNIIKHTTISTSSINGLNYIYFPNGNKKEVRFINNGILIKDSIFNSKGNLIITKIFQDGELIHSEEYNEQGKLQKENNFLYNKKHGVQKQYFPTGNPEVVEKYENGDLLSKEIFDKNGQIIDEQNYKLNKKHGLQKKYDVNANLIELEEYNMGKLIRKERYTEQGKELINITGNLAEIETYNDKGKLIQLYYESLPDKQKDSISLTFDPATGNKLYEIAYKQGKIIREGSYVNNKKNGIWKYHWQDGKKLTTITYKDDKIASKETLTYAKQLKNNIQSGDIILARIVSTPRKNLQLILVRLDTTQIKTPYKLIRERIIKVLTNTFKTIQNIDKYKEQELYSILSFENYEYKFRPKANNNKKFIAYIKFKLIENNLKNEKQDERMFMIIPLENKYLKGKKQAFFNTLENLEKRISIDLQNRFPCIGSISKIIDRNKTEITEVNVFFDDMGNIKEKDILSVYDNKDKPFAQIKVVKKNTHSAVCKVVNGGKRLKYLIENINPNPVVKFLPSQKP